MGLNLKKTAFLAIALIFSMHASANILVPAYFYPSLDPAQSNWDEMTAAASKTNITAIMNPANGSGSAANSDYTAAINTFRAAGGQVIGYVPTTYGARAQADVLAEVSKYQHFYNVDGIFLDEMSNLASNLAYYQTVYGGIKAINSAYSVFGNAGTNTLEGYLTAADVLVTFENQTGYATYVPDAWTQNYAANRFEHLLYNVGSESTMLSDIALAQERNAGYVYVTDDNNANPNSINNPWDTLPSYWNAEVNRVTTPLPASGVLLFSSLGLMGLWRKYLVKSTTY